MTGSHISSSGQMHHQLSDPLKHGEYPKMCLVIFPLLTDCNYYIIIIITQVLLATQLSWIDITIGYN